MVAIVVTTASASIALIFAINLYLREGKAARAARAEAHRTLDRIYEERIARASGAIGDLNRVFGFPSSHSPREDSSDGRFGDYC